MYTETIEQSLQDQITEAEEELGRLKSALIALNGVPTPRVAPRDRPPRRRPSRNGRPLDPEHVFAAIRGGAHTSPAIAEEIGSKSETVLRMLRQFEKAGQVKRSGERAKTRWDLAAV